MNADLGRKLFSESCPAVFKAGFGGNQPRVIVYPLKNETGFCWAIWDDKMDYDDITRSIKDGGKFPAGLHLHDAAAEALSRLFQYAANKK